MRNININFTLISLVGNADYRVSSIGHMKRKINISFLYAITFTFFRWPSIWAENIRPKKITRKDTPTLWGIGDIQDGITSVVNCQTQAKYNDVNVVLHSIAMRSESGYYGTLVDTDVKHPSWSRVFLNWLIYSLTSSHINDTHIYDINVRNGNRSRLLYNGRKNIYDCFVMTTRYIRSRKNGYAGR